MKRISVLIGLALCAVGLAVFALNRDFARDMLISDAEARALPDGRYVILLSIDNQGAPDRLLSANSDMGQVDLYSPVDPDGPPVPAGTASLAMDGAHITLASPAPLPDGTLIPLQLEFETAGTLRIKARLRSATEIGAAAEVGLFGLGEICIGGENGEPAPAITLTTAQDDTGWTITVITDEFEFSRDLAGAYHVPGVGHGHIYVGGMKLGRLYQPSYHIGALPAGRHEIRVTLNTNDHRAYVVDDQPVTASAFVTSGQAENS